MSPFDQMAALERDFATDYPWITLAGALLLAGWWLLMVVRVMFTNPLDVSLTRPKLTRRRTSRRLNNDERR